MASTVIIFDWDDTLFPTTWLTSNKLNIYDINVRQSLLPLFVTLDRVICNVLNRFMLYGEVFIITNALPDWIKISCSMLPKSSIILKNINIVSARKLYQYRFPDTMEWKKHAFKNLIRTYDDSFLNIISIGDADYEYFALINLYNYGEKKKKFLKPIKLIKNPSLNIIIDQLTILSRCVQSICRSGKHLDLSFVSS